MVSAILGGLGLATSIGSAITGAVVSSKKNREAAAIREQQREKNEAWYNAKKAEDLTQRADVLAMINKQREMLKDRYSASRAANIVAGGTDESLALQQEAANQALAETMSNIAAEGVQEKREAENQYLQRDNALDQAELAQKQQEAANAAQAAGQLASAGINVAGNAFANSDVIKLKK